MNNESALVALAMLAIVTSLALAYSVLTDIRDGIHRIASVLEELDKKKEGE